MQKNSFLRPIKSKTLRLIFGFDNSLENLCNPLHVMQPAINHFEKFAINRFFWFIVDLKNWKNICGGGEIEKMTPLKTHNFFNDSHQLIHDITHPADLHHVNAFSRFWVNFYLTLPHERRPYSKMTMYFRILNAKKEYYWIMVQYSDAIFDSNGQFVYGLVFATDISHLKNDGDPMLSILDTYNGNCQHFFCTHKTKLNLVEKNSLYNLTTKEREVLYYLAIGYSSKQIASELNLSIKTIDNHRQNMLHKTQSKSTGELIANCSMNGYI